MFTFDIHRFIYITIVRVGIKGNLWTNIFLDFRGVWLSRILSNDLLVSEMWHEENVSMWSHSRVHLHKVYIVGRISEVSQLYFHQQTFAFSATSWTPPIIIFSTQDRKQQNRKKKRISLVEIFDRTFDTVGQRSNAGLATYYKSKNTHINGVERGDKWKSFVGAVKFFSVCSSWSFNFIEYGISYLWNSLACIWNFCLRNHREKQQLLRMKDHW